MHGINYFRWQPLFSEEIFWSVWSAGDKNNIQYSSVLITDWKQNNGCVFNMTHTPFFDKLKQNPILGVAKDCSFLYKQLLLYLDFLSFHSENTYFYIHITCIISIFTFRNSIQNTNTYYLEKKVYGNATGS